jgi:hypothetical protein
MEIRADIAAQTQTFPVVPRPGALQYVFRGSVLRRNALIALIVGTLLTLANQLDVILRAPLHAPLIAKICFNFVIPFAVSSFSAHANRCRH